MRKLAVGIVLTGFMIFYLNTVSGQSFKPADSFFPNSDQINKDDVVWGYLNVPEVWDAATSDTINIAVCVLKKKTKSAESNAVVFIEGGPGASGIQDISAWLKHPLRNNNDIVLIDVRGTGFSKPRLSPDLGKEILDILAKDQSAEEDEKQKLAAVLAAKKELSGKGINTNAYNSLSVAKDLHALKMLLGYHQWTVYGVSYGTYIAQVYANANSGDIKTMILDSSIPDISTYYTYNTSNYLSGLSKVFENCKNDKGCNLQYPDLENTYYQVIKELQTKPIEVKVSRDLIKTGSFTYNAEDFKVAIQQALYRKKIIGLIPLIIQQFHERNEVALGNMVEAFSTLINMDYGVYYCFSCNEVIPNNSFVDYEKNASQFTKLGGGISFYRSDFKVCNAWNAGKQPGEVLKYNLDSLKTATFPVLVFSGEYDPITPLINGQQTASRFKTAYNVVGYTFGHVPGFSEIGFQVADKFVSNAQQQPDMNAYKKATSINMVTGISMNGGVSKMGKSINQFDPLFISPLALAAIIMMVSIVVTAVKLIRRKYKTRANVLLRLFLASSSIIGLVVIIGYILALLDVAGQNYFILAFGLPQKFNYLFVLTLCFLAMLVFTFVFFFITIKNTTNRSALFSVMFSNALLATYIIYWGIV